MTCPVCARHDAADGLVICGGCLGRIDGDLEHIAELTSLAASQATPERRSSAPGPAKPGSRPPLSVDAVDAAQGLAETPAGTVLAVLESWVRLVREEAALAPYGIATEHQDVTVAVLVGFLRPWLLWCAERPDWPVEDMALELRQCRAVLERWNPARNGPRTGIPLDCAAEHPDADGRPCGYRLHTNGADIVTCPRCRTDYTPDELLDAHDMDLLPAAVLILLDDREPSAARRRIAYLTERGDLTIHEHRPQPGGGKPVPLYRLGEYRNVLSTTRATG